MCLLRYFSRQSSCDLSNPSGPLSASNFCTRSNQRSKRDSCTHKYSTPSPESAENHFASWGMCILWNVSCIISACMHVNNIQLCAGQLYKIKNTTKIFDSKNVHSIIELSEIFVLRKFPDIQYIKPSAIHL